MKQLGWDLQQQAIANDMDAEQPGDSAPLRFVFAAGAWHQLEAIDGQRRTRRLLHKDGKKDQEEVAQPPAPGCD
jgi:hypothetical protein